MIAIRELLDIVAMTAAVGYIFMPAISAFRLRPVKGFDFKAFWIACVVTAPALILHELLHKFVAVSYGLNATFHAAYPFLALGIGLRLLGSKFIFFIPGYVSISSTLQLSSLQQALIAGSGPAVNGVLGLLAWLMFGSLKKKVAMKYLARRKLPPKSLRTTMLVLYLTMQINILLLVFNMLPIPPFDGWKFWSGLVKAVF
ncbi:MAG: M50 family metallopeptidase [Candidatus Woesearchaeota archaeon]